MDYEIIKPISGGGLGDCKVGIYQITGTYQTGGIDIGIKDQPIFMMTDAGYTAEFNQETNKVLFKSSGTEITDGDDVDGVKIIAIIKGSF